MYWQRQQFIDKQEILPVEVFNSEGPKLEILGRRTSHNFLMLREIWTERREGMSQKFGSTGLILGLIVHQG